METSYQLSHEDKLKLHEHSLKVQKISTNFAMAGTYIFLLILALFVIVPFYWMINVALQTHAEAMGGTVVFFPHAPQFRNFYTVLTTWNLGRYMLNTVGVGVVSSVLGTVLTIFAAFAMSRLNFKGKGVLFAIFLSTMMVPGEMFVMTNFLTIRNGFGWQPPSPGSPFSVIPYLSLIVPFLTSVFAIYQLRQAFRIIPNELYYAAKVDGVSDWKYLWRVMVPQAKATLTMIFILRLMGSWNSFAWPNLVTTAEYQLITNGLRRAGNPLELEFHLEMAGVFVVTVPLLIVYMIFRKQIMQGVSRSGIKG